MTARLPGIGDDGPRGPGALHRVRQLIALLSTIGAVLFVTNVVCTHLLGLDRETTRIVAAVALLPALPMGLGAARSVEPHTEQQRRDTKTGLLWLALFIAVAAVISLAVTVVL